jgi:hypothetical protein
MYDANIKRVDASVKVSVESRRNGNGNGIPLRNGFTGSMTKGSKQSRVSGSDNCEQERAKETNRKEVVFFDRLVVIIMAGT